MQIAKTATVHFDSKAAKREFRRQWKARTGYAFESRDLLATDGAERAADLALGIVGLRVAIIEERDAQRGVRGGCGAGWGCECDACESARAHETVAVEG